jgi:hypothetical protein
MGVELGLVHFGRNRLSVFENRVLREISVAKAENLRGWWITLTL